MHWLGGERERNEAQRNCILRTETRPGAADEAADRDGCFRSVRKPQYLLPLQPLEVISIRSGWVWADLLACFLPCGPVAYAYGSRRYEGTNHRWERLSIPTEVGFQTSRCCQTVARNLRSGDVRHPEIHRRGQEFTLMYILTIQWK